MTEVVSEQLWMLLIVPVFALWPYFFIRYKKGENHFLFVSAFYGALAVTTALLSAIAIPLWIFLAKLVPQFEVFGWAGYLEPFIQVCEAIADWYWILIFPGLYFALPPLLYRRYAVFRLTSSASRTG